MTAAKKLVLVVDDEPDVVSYLTALFEDNGYATVSAGDGNQALAQIAKKKPDLITLDMSMPGKSGVKAYREIRDNPDLAQIPVLVVTGVTGFGGKPEEFEKFLGTRKQFPPPDGFIAKPLDREALLKKVKGLIG